MIVSIYQDGKCGSNKINITILGAAEISMVTFYFKCIHKHAKFPLLPTARNKFTDIAAIERQGNALIDMEKQKNEDEIEGRRQAERLVDMDKKDKLADLRRRGCPVNILPYSNRSLLSTSNLDESRDRDIEELV